MCTKYLDILFESDKITVMESLAEFIQTNREKLGLTTLGLAKKANLELQVLEDIESGKDLFLSVSQRQKLARVFKCSPNEFKLRERSYEFKLIEYDKIAEIRNKILKHETNLRCPMCGEPLVTRIAKMYDLEDNLTLIPKAHCVKCIFQIKE